MTALDERLDRMVTRYQEVAARLAETEGGLPENFAQLGKELAELTTVVEAINQLKRARSEALELELLANDADADADMRELAREGVPLNIIQRQLGHANLGTMSIYLQGIDPEEIIATVRTRRAPMMSASAGLQL